MADLPELAGSMDNMEKLPELVGSPGHLERWMRSDPAQVQELLKQALPSHYQD